MSDSETREFTDRRSISTEVIEHMLAERQQLLSLLVEVSNIRPDVPDPELLDEFCQVLVDYVASGHFGLYQRIIDKQERRRGVRETAVEVYPRIEETTRIALDFNEKYESEKRSTDLSSIHEDLSLLGEALTNRIENEDLLITKMLDGSTEVVS